MRLTQADHARVAAAIADAEAKTSGEIFAIVETSVPRYPLTALAGAILAAFVLPFAAVFAGFDPSVIYGGWKTEAPSVLRIVEGYAAVQAATFLTLLLLLAFTPLNRLLTPRSHRRARVHRVANAQFLSHGLHVTRERTGVLLFVSLADHMAEIIADDGIAAKVGPEVWGDTLDELLVAARAGRHVDGFVAAIAAAGAVLASHFPPRSDNPDELPNALLEL
jgi:putative membrane protein